MKITILSDEHFPHVGADTLVIMSTASALGALGADVELVTPWMWHRHRNMEELFDHYGVKPTFRVVRLPSWPPPERTLRLEKFMHGLAGPLHAALRRSDVVHSRDLLPLLFSRVVNLPWSFETYRRHSQEKPWLPPITRRLGLKRAVGAIAHSPASAEDLVRLGFDPDAVIVARPGHDPNHFSPRLNKSAARRRCGLEVKKKIVSYVGNLSRSKGTDEIVDLAGRIPEVEFVLVGGSAAEVETMRAALESRRLSNVRLTGHRPPAEVVQYLYAADILLVPAILKNTFSGSLSQYLPMNILPGTPLKLYNYLAAGRPIVSADQPHTRDLLRHEKTALMVPPQDGEAGAQAIRRILNDSALAKRLATNARSEAREYTWQERAKKILSFYERRLNSARV